MRKTTWIGRFAGTTLTAALVVGAFGNTTAHAATCLSMAPGVALASFTSCTASGNDFLPAVQTALNNAIEPDVTLTFMGSYSPGPDSEGEEFKGDRPADNFNITPNTVGNTNTYTFLSLPIGTDFIVFKQGRDFEIFNVYGLTPGFTLTHSLGNDTSHISTFASTLPTPTPTPAPEPMSLAMFGLGLAGLGIAARRRLRKVA